MSGLQVEFVDLCRVNHCALYTCLVLAAEVLTGPPAYPETIRECCDFVLENLLWRWRRRKHFSRSLLGGLGTLGWHGCLFHYSVARGGRWLCWWVRGTHGRLGPRDKIDLPNCEIGDDHFAQSFLYLVQRPVLRWLSRAISPPGPLQRLHLGRPASNMPSSIASDVRSVRNPTCSDGSLGQVEHKYLSFPAFRQI